MSKPQTSLIEDQESGNDLAQERKTPKPRILLIEDEEFRQDLKDVLEGKFELDVYPPDSFEAMRKSVLLRLYDGALSDIRLKEWHVSEGQGKKINGRTVKDGIDIVDFYHDIHRNVALALYSTHMGEPVIQQKINNLSFDVMTIRKLTDIDNFAESFSPFIEKARRAHEINQEWMLESDKARQLSFNERLAAYERACSLNQTWVNTTLHTYGDLSWGVLCKKDIVVCGESLLDPPAPVSPEVQVIPRLEQQILDDLEARTGFYPFTFWNTGNPAYLEKHFQLAGPHLTYLPPSQRDYFGFAMSGLLEQAYRDEPGKEVLQWVEHLTPEGQLEVCRRIFKSLLQEDPSRLEEFHADCRELNLPIVVEILKGCVGEIDEENNTAYIEFSKPDKHRPLTQEPFKFNLLTDNGVKYEGQEFKFTVYKYATGGVAMNIKLMLPDQDPFDFIN